MNRDPRGLYAALGVGPDATGADIRRRYRALLRSLHPDVGAPGGEDVRRVLEAFAVLRHPESRVNYDPAYGRTDGFERAAGRDIPVRRHATQPLVRVTPVRWERGPW
ncbi:J domain-containing protein [Arthrobacter sp. BPSS-3]|uniref:J domain-containing protein n=1 Tax=Arthrobacter sp. BPSS-3 TaxID=3366580 RepID=UPI0037DD833F